MQPVCAPLSGGWLCLRRGFVCYLSANNGRKLGGISVSWGLSAAAFPLVGLANFVEDNLERVEVLLSLLGDAVHLLEGG